MSTTANVSVVKQELLAKIEICQQQLRLLATALPESLEELSAAETLIRDEMLKLGRRLLQAWSETADATTAAPACSACGETMRPKGYLAGPLVTTLGNVRVRFRCVACGNDVYPQDARLRFLNRGISPPLAKVVARMGAQLPFAQAQQNLETDYGVHLSKRTMQLVCEETGMAVVDAEDRARELWQSLPPAVDADDQPLQVDHRARFLSCDDFGYQLMLQARDMGYHHARVKAFIADGARWLWDQAAAHFPDAVRVLDWYHLAEHIHQTANVLYPEGGAESKRFSKQRLKELWEGHATQTLRRLKAIRKKTRSPAKRESLRQLIGYLTNNRGRIKYPLYRELGLKVGSGQVEGACKSPVGARCKQAGMRNWTREGAQGVLRIRAALQTGQYDALWQNLTTTAA